MKQLTIQDYEVSWDYYSMRMDDYTEAQMIVTATSKQNAIDLIKSNHKRLTIIAKGKRFEAREIEVTNYEQKQYKLK